MSLTFSQQLMILCNSYLFFVFDFFERYRVGQKKWSDVFLLLFFLMKNFGCACEISLFNPLEFILSSRENDIGKVAAARVDDDHTGPFYGIYEYFP